MQERLQKILSTRGICSRRKAEEYLRRGLVKVNDVVAILGQKADPAVDRIEVDGRVLEERKEMLYYVMNKPLGVITSNEGKEGKESKEGTRTVRDLLPKHLQGKIYPVGRLDKDSSGLLLLTNDGVLAYRLTHPKFDHEKEYEVAVDRPFPDRFLRKLAGGVPLKGEEMEGRKGMEGMKGGTYRTKPATCRRVSSRKLRMTLTEGRHRQIRRMCQQYGYTVKSLKRVRIATLEDPRLPEGSMRPLTAMEREELLRSIEA